MRDCGGCRQSKPTEAFYHHAGRPYGPCKSCRCRRARSRYQATVGELERLRMAVQVQLLAGGELA